MAKVEPGQSFTLGSTWTIGARIRSGGFGAVHEVSRDDDVAYVAKFVHADPGADRELLFSEQPPSPFIVPVVDKGPWDDLLVLVMPRAEKSLHDELQSVGGRLPVVDAIRVLLDVASGLAAIDGAVVHRDLKPSNVVYLDERWQIADFGIARYANAATAHDTRKHSMTPPYAAPEQWRGEHASAATDVYAFGVVAFELLSGNRPFRGPSEQVFRDQHLHATPPPLQGVPADVQSLVGECLLKAPGARPSAQNLVARLNRRLARPVAIEGLERANRLAVERMTEAERRASTVRSQEARTVALREAARSSLDALSHALLLAIRDHASAAQIKSGTGDIRFHASLLQATLSFGGVRDVSAAEGIPFDVVTAASIKVQLPRKYDWDGREHSLWYCDAKEEGRYRWFETAFDMNPITGRRAYVSPFALPPDDNAARALLPGITSFVMSWPFTPVDQGDETAFVARWLTWFGDASLGVLNIQSTSHPPGVDGSWRRR